MTSFKRHRLRKELKEALHYAKHVRHMFEDIGNPEELLRLRESEKAARELYRSGAGGSEPEVTKAIEEIAKVCHRISPPRKHPKLRENIEVFFVAIAAAMAIRAYFFQPFKIPTGSMQPTLYGITARGEPTIKSNLFPARLANLIFFGERNQSVRAKNSGHFKMSVNGYGNTVPYYQENPDNTVTFYIGNVPHKVPVKLASTCRFGEFIRKGEPIASGIIKSGDYILVNRLKYNFMRPGRGDIVVFDTHALTHPKVRKNAYYIKRLVGMPNEIISLAPPYLLVNGEKPAEKQFNKIFNDPRYAGYEFGSLHAYPPPLLAHAGNQIQLKDDEYLFFGDNTAQSLDGRYFGAVQHNDLMGPAFFVCWPFNRFGSADGIRN